MFKKTMSYTDFDGNARKEDFYFNLTKAECAEWELSEDGGLTALLERMIQRRDNKKTIETFKEIILKAYGEKSLDGKYFVKNEQIRDQFASTQAFSDLFMELGTNDLAAIEFLNGILPTESKIGIDDAKKLMGDYYVGDNNSSNGAV